MLRALAILAACSALAANAQTPPPETPRPVIPFFVAGNFPRDLLGINTGTDDRPNSTWGWEDSDTLPIQFYPPPGYRTEILEIHGDLISAFKIVGNKPPIRKGSAGYVLVGFSTTQLVGYPGPGVPCNFCA